MARERKQKGRRAGPPGIPYALPHWWRTALRAWLAEHEPADKGGWNQTKLADAVGCNGGMISKILNDTKVLSSALVGPICDVTGLPIPNPDSDPETAEFLRLAKKLREVNPDLYASQLRHIKDLLKTLRALTNDNDSE